MPIENGLLQRKDRKCIIRRGHYERAGTLNRRDGTASGRLRPDAAGARIGAHMPAVRTAAHYPHFAVQVGGGPAFRPTVAATRGGEFMIALT